MAEKKEKKEVKPKRGERKAEALKSTGERLRKLFTQAKVVELKSHDKLVAFKIVGADGRAIVLPRLDGKFTVYSGGKKKQVADLKDVTLEKTKRESKPKAEKKAAPAKKPKAASAPAKKASKPKAEKKAAAAPEAPAPAEKKEQVAEPTPA